jgi:hypothetical protein
MTYSNHASDIKLIVLHINCDKVFTSLINSLVSTAHTISEIKGESSSIG